VRAATVMVRSHAAQVERMAHERVVLLPTARGEANEVAQRVSSLESELVAARRAQDVVEEKIPSLAAKTVAAKR
jgi:hypothetical protein